MGEGQSIFLISNRPQNPYRLIILMQNGSLIKRVFATKRITRVHLPLIIVLSDPDHSIPNTYLGETNLGPILYILLLSKLAPVSF